MILKGNFNTRSTGLFIFGWFVVTILGYAFVGLMFHYPSGFPPNNGEQWNLPGLAFGIFMGALSGLVIGGLQALVLRVRFMKVRWWLVANVGAFAIIHATGDGLPDGSTYTALQISGVFLGVALWLAVKTQGANAIYWIGGVSVLWAVGLTAGLNMANRSTDSWALAHEIVGLCTGFAVALATAILLRQLMGSRAPMPKVQSA